MRRLFCSAVFVLLISSIVLSAPINSEEAVNYFSKIVELIIKQDVSALHKRFTPEVQQKISKEYLKEFLKNTLDGVGEPKGMTLSGFNIYPNNPDYCQVQGVVEFSNEKVIVTAVLKKTEKGFAIHHLNLNLPSGANRINKLAGKAKDFLKGVFFETLKNQGVDNAMGYIDSDVRKQVGDDIIRPIITKLRDVTIEGVKKYNVQNTTEGTVHRFVLAGVLKNKPCDVEVILKPRGDSFVIVDVNIYQQQ